MSRTLPLPLVAAATIIAVSFWSLKPIFISLIGDRTGYAEVFLIAGAISTSVSVIAALLMARKTYSLVTAEGFGAGLVQSLISGGFLAMWYYSFYRALYGAGKIDTTIIAFSWPLIAVVAMRVFAPKHARKLKPPEWALLITAYLGAIAVGISGISRGDSLGGTELLFAFVAAIGSGLYLPFAINAIWRFTEILGNRILATFYVVSFANAASLVLVSSLLMATDQTLLFFAVDGWVILICALIGIGTYLLAEITWAWAFSEYKSLTLSSLVYLSPAFSVVLLYVFFDEPIAAVSAFGLVLILFSNLTLHGSYQSTNAIVLALIGTLYVALISLFIAPAEVPRLTDMLYFISGLFAILAGFILSRVSSRRAQEIDQRTSMVRAIVAPVDLTDETATDKADAILRGVIDIEFVTDLGEKDSRADIVRQRLRESAQPAGVQREQSLEFEIWLNIHRDRLSLGEKAALWLTGGMSIFLLLVVRGNDPLSTIGLYAFAAGCLLVIFSITDYERNSFQGFRRQILRLQDGFHELGRPDYLPKSLVDSSESLGLFDNAKIRYCDDDGLVCEQTVVKKRNTFRALYFVTSFLMVGALLTLPIFMASENDDGAVLALRPEMFADDGWVFGGDAEADIVVGVFDWSASHVISEIVKQTLEAELGVQVSLQDTTVEAIFPILDSEDGAIDVHSDFWAGNQAENLARYVEGRQSVRLNEAPYPGRQGIYLPEADAERFGLAQLSDLADPEISAAFDTDGDGRGEIWIGAPGWQSTRATEQLLMAYGFLDNWEPQEFSDTIMKAKLRQFRSQDRPIVFYGFEPDWIHAEYDLRALSISPQDGQCPEILGIVAMGDGCAFEPVPVHIGVASRLEETHPEAAELLAAISFRTEDVNTWLAALSTETLSPAEVASRWLAQNPELVRSWRTSALRDADRASQ